MFRNLDNQTQQTDRQHGRAMQQVLGVLGEEEYFARQESERKRRLAAERQATLLAEERERERALHQMKCPKCGMQLEEIALGDVRVDKCFFCEGLWLDKGELELIRQKEGGFLGSTSTHLMRKCPCPIWVMKAGRRRQYARVLAAVNPAPADQDHNSLNLKIMELATSLSRLEMSQLHVVHVWTPVAKWLKFAGSRLPESELAKLERSNEEEHLNWFDELLAKVPLDGLNIQRHMLKGDASDLIPRLALRKGIDVIVMGTACRAGVPGLFIGNTAEKVLRHVSCSVLTIKPEGFVSPIAV